MLWSKLFIPTLREDPAEAETPGHRLLLRAGYIRPLAAGHYSHLFLSRRSLLKITAIVRDEMARIGAQEILLPALHPPHAVMTAIARELRSYKQFPQIWYQIQTQFREQPRARQFIMLDSCSFDLTPEGLEAAREKLDQAYNRIFQCCGLAVVSLGDADSREFIVDSDAGEDFIAICPKCGNTAAREKAPLQPDPEGALDPQEFHTPGRKTIADVAAFTGLPETSQMKSLVMVADGQPVLALLRGDHQLDERLLAKAVGALSELRAASPSEIQHWFGATAGSLGPVGVKNMRILADHALRNRRNMIAGANRDDYHLRNVTPGKDFSAGFCRLRQVVAGDTCLSCNSAIEIRTAIQLGHASALPTTGLHVLDAEGREVAPIVGSYSLAIDRILSSVVEQHHDQDGIILPAAIAPFAVVITPVNFADLAQRQAAEAIYRACLAEGLDVLLDDRDERPGVKFKDADLIGIPWRIVVGKKLPQGVVEVVERRTRQSTDAAVSEVHKNFSSISTR